MKLDPEQLASVGREETYLDAKTRQQNLVPQIQRQVIKECQWGGNERNVLQTRSPELIVDGSSNQAVGGTVIQLLVWKQEPVAEVIGNDKGAVCNADSLDEGHFAVSRSSDNVLNGMDTRNTYC